jgi:hypothetical protein
VLPTADSGDTDHPYSSCFTLEEGVKAAESFAVMGMRLPPLQPNVKQRLESCFQLFSVRTHAEFISDVIKLSS